MGHDFAVENADGVNIYYVKTSDTEVAVSFRGSFASEYINHYAGNVVIPETVTYQGKTYSITSIGDYAFYYCQELLSVKIPNNIASIGINPFCECSNLASIIIDSGNNNYDSRNNCNAVIESSTNTLLCGCQNTAIPNSVIGIGAHAFNGSNIVSIDIPNSVTIIGDRAFEGCKELTSIVIPNSVTSIGICAFARCISLTTVGILANINNIGEGMFVGCSCLASIEIPNSVECIGDYAFYNCSSLPSIIIGSNVSTIGNEAFVGCNNLTSVTINSNTLVSTKRNYDTSFSNIFGTQVESYILGDKITCIGDNAFYYCSNLSSVTIPRHVTSIGDNAFYRCGNLVSVTVKMKTPISISSGTFGSRSNATLYIPTGSKSAYQTADFWKEFKEIIEMAPDYELGDINGDDVVDVSDYIGVANHILGNTPAGFNALAADVNGDQVVDISDYIGVANIILTGSIYGNNASSRPFVESEEPTQEPQ